MANHIGSPLTFTERFLNTAGVATDPTVITFWLREGIGGTELQWTYNAAPVAGTHYPIGANPVVRDSAGVYHVVWVTRKAERHTGAWQGTGAVTQADQETQFVRHPDVSALEV